MNLVYTIRKKSLRLAKRFVKNVTLSLYFPWVYKRAAARSIDSRNVVFLENKQASLPDSFKVMYGFLDDGYEFDLKFVSLGQNRVRFARYCFNCRDAIREIATAKYVFLNDASDVVSCLPLREETKVIQLWHACGAFKKWGMSTAELLFGGSRRDLLRHPFYKNLSLVTVSSPEVSWAYVEAMVLEDRPHIVKPLGVSRTDRFFDEGYVSTAKANIEKLIPEAKKKKIILYAPTFRGHVASAEGPDRLDIERFREEFSDNYLLVINHHPFVKACPKIPDSCKGFAFDVSGDVPIDEVLICADVCISDYSSLVFEYSLLGRPMLFFAYDIDDYKDWRGFYYDYKDLTPGPVCSTNDQMIDYIRALDARFDKGDVEAFRERFMSACDGHATERICQEVFGDDLARYCMPRAHDVLWSENSYGVDVSIVVPAYNALPELTRALESVVKQTYDLSRMEVIVVDDCSTDGTWDEMKRFASRYPELFVIERLKEPSGSPAQPRNVGLNKARGTYVFFLDADDWLGDEAVERMLDHAVEWDSDVLLVKMEGENGREVPKSMFTENQSKVDVFKSKVMWSFAPLKLFRHSLIRDLRFPAFMPEDISFVLRAYCVAKTVSVAADYEYYYVSWRNEGGHASLSTWNDVDSNLAAYQDICDFICDNIPEDERGHVLMRRFLRRDVYRTTMVIARSGDAKAKRKYEQLVQIVGPLYQREAYRTCPIKERVVLDAALLGDFDILRAAARLGESLPQACSFELIDGRLVCFFNSDAGGLSCDVTDAFSASCRVRLVTGLEDAFLMQGDITVPEACGDGTYRVLLEADDKAQIAAFPVALGDGREATSCNDIPCSVLFWRARVPYAALIGLKHASVHRLVMAYDKNGWEQRHTLGPNRELGTKQSFLGLSYSAHGKKLVPSIGAKGAFLLRTKIL